MAPASWVCGNKLVYIDRHRPDFEAAPESQRSDVYRAVARGLMCLAGDAPFDFNFRTHDIDDGEIEPTQADHDKLTNMAGLSTDECKRRRAIIVKLSSDLSQYYRRKDQQLNRSVPIDFTRLGLALAGKHKITITNRPSQYYSVLYYTERIKAKFEKRFATELAAWEAEKKTAEETGTAFTKDCPTDIGVRTVVTNECWAQETPECRAMVEKLHAEALEKQRQDARDLVGMNLPSTPEEYQRLYDTAAFYIQPYADAFSTAFKGVVAVMICAPMPEDGGNLGVVSIHSGTSRGFVQTKWPYGVCKDGFRRAEQELLEFGEHVFSHEDKQAAALPFSASTTTASSASAPETQNSTEDVPAPATNTTTNDESHVNNATHLRNASTTSHDEETHENDEETHENGEETHENSEETHENDELDSNNDLANDAARQHEQSPPQASRPTTPMADEPLFLHDSSPLARSRAGSVSQPSRLASQLDWTQPDPGSQSPAPRNEASRSPSVRASSEPPPPHDLDVPMSQPALDIPPSQPVHALARQRTTRTSSAPSALGSASSIPAAMHGVWKIPVAPTWSEHVRLTVEVCRRCGQTWAVAFGDVVESYIKFEEVHGFSVKDAGCKIISKKTIRPSQYSLWTKTARPYNRSMPIPNLDEFGQQWWRWLAEHFPEKCRVPNSYLLDLSRVDVSDSATWNGLDKACGKDGMLQFVLSLLWWGNAVHGPGVQDATRRDNWEAACIELSGILRAMSTSTVKAGSKRKSSGDGEGSIKKKPRQSLRAPANVASATSSTSARPRRR